MKLWLHCALIAVMAVATSYGDIEIPGVPPENLGTDGDLYIDGGSTTYIDLQNAVTGDWFQAGDGNGVYTPEKWAVVFKYSSVTINKSYSDRYVKFINHPSGAPVVWLVSGDVNITQGRLDVSGQGSQGSTAFATPGPGGYRGGRGKLVETLGSGGFGPGGGDYVYLTGSSAGSYGTEGESSLAWVPPMYGNVFILPLIGGSGGAADHTSTDSRGGGAGGGAILIVATGTINIGGGAQVLANGGAGTRYASTGSGGSIRLIADRVEGSGLLRAKEGTLSYGDGNYGGKGRIFVQANEILLTDEGDPVRTDTNFTDSPYYIWPPDETEPDPAPSIWPVKLVVDETDVIIPTDPQAKLDFPLADVSFDTLNNVTLHIEAAYVPLSWSVAVRIVAKAGDSQIFYADPLAGTLESSTTTATLTLPRGFGAIQVRAFDPGK